MRRVGAAGNRPHRNNSLRSKGRVESFCSLAAVLLRRRKLNARENTQRCYEQFFDPLCADTNVWPDYTEGHYPMGNESYDQAKLNQFDYIFDKIQVKPGTKIMDIGCGNGNLLLRARERRCHPFSRRLLCNQKRNSFATWPLFYLAVRITWCFSSLSFFNYRMAQRSESKSAWVGDSQNSSLTENPLRITFSPAPTPQSQGNLQPRGGSRNSQRSASSSRSTSRDEAGDQNASKNCRTRKLAAWGKAFLLDLNEWPRLQSWLWTRSCRIVTPKPLPEERVCSFFPASVSPKATDDTTVADTTAPIPLLVVGDGDATRRLSHSTSGNHLTAGVGFGGPPAKNDPLEESNRSDASNVSAGGEQEEVVEEESLATSIGFAVLFALELILRCVAEVFTMNHPLCGALILAGLAFTSWHCAVLALVGCICENGGVIAFAKRRLGDPESRLGLYGYDGILAALACYTFLLPKAVPMAGIYCVAVITSTFAGVLRCSLGTIFKTIGMLPLTFSFCLTAVSLVTAADRFITPATPATPPTPATPSTIPIDVDFFVNSIFRGIGQITFADSTIGGILITIALAVASRRAALGALFGAAAATVFAVLLLPENAMERVVLGLFGYNSALTGTALAGGVFLPERTIRNVLFVPVVGACLAFPVHLVWQAAMPATPVMTLPFVFTTWALHPALTFNRPSEVVKAATKAKQLVSKAQALSAMSQVFYSPHNPLPSARVLGAATAEANPVESLQPMPGVEKVIDTQRGGVFLSGLATPTHLALGGFDSTDVFTIAIDNSQADGPGMNGQSERRGSMESSLNDGDGDVSINADNRGDDGELSLRSANDTPLN